MLMAYLTILRMLTTMPYLCSSVVTISIVVAAVSNVSIRNCK